MANERDTDTRTEDTAIPVNTPASASAPNRDLIEPGTEQRHGFDLNEDGHLEFTWTPGDPESERMARAQFNQLQREGKALYRIDPDQSRTKLNEFDPMAPRIGAVQPNAGG
jgi:hypothetical protein